MNCGPLCRHSRPVVAFVVGDYGTPFQKGIALRSVTAIFWQPTPPSSGGCPHPSQVNHQICIGNAEILEFQSTSPIPEAEADGNRVEGKVDVQRERASKNRTRPIRQTARIREFHYAVENTTPGYADAEWNIQHHDHELTIFIRVQLSNSGKLEHNPEKHPCE
jgi:hypothetical protein